MGRMKGSLKYIFLILSSLLFSMSVRAQEIRSFNEDSLKAILEITGRDSTRVNILLLLSESFFFKNPDTSFFYGDKAVELSRELNFTRGLLEGLVKSGEAERQLGHYVDAMKRNWELLELSGRIKDKRYQAIATGLVGLNYRGLHDYDRAVKFLRRSLDMHATLHPEFTEVVFSVFLANAYLMKHMTDSAFYFLRASEHRYRAREIQIRVFKLASLGIAFSQVKAYDSMNYYYRKALITALPDPEGLPNHFSGLASNLSNILISQNQIDSAFWLSRLAFKVANKANINARVYEASEILSNLHRLKGNLDSALYYQDISIARKDSIFGEENIRELQLLLLDEQRRSQEVQQAEERFQNNIFIIGLATITAIILAASILLFRSNRTKQKTNLVLQQTLNELNATQSQLIQSEKMASLGELTAGIAHEIQNPLNFVNNFSELNAELIDDLRSELAAGNRQSADEVAGAIKENQEKINQHGKRAEGIVKSMLQHSRTSTGQKELTDINALCDEYVRLAYHGFRAKDKSFTAEVKTNFDSILPKLNVVPQDMGRAILNLINNAFYAVGERSKSGSVEYTPTVIITTKKSDGKVMIKVEDNGSGIPEHIKAKVFQPFFTTKPTGQGTGLGLSLSYDIIKAHGGTLLVNSPPAGRAGTEGMGSEFIVQIPV